MLALSRTTRRAKEVSRHVRTLSTITPAASLPDTGAAEIAPGIPFLKTTVTRKPRRQLARSSAECMIVYPWNGIRSSTQGLAIARAVQEKYGPAKEVILPRDTDSITNFQPFLWLVYDNADVRKRLPEESAQIRVRVADLPKGDGNVGVEEMVRALGLSTDKGASLKPPPPAEGEDEVSADAADDHKALDVRVEWARHGPNEVLQRRRPPPYATLPEKLKPDFAAAWLAFDGFSPDAARGAHTPNLIRAREKWRVLAPSVNNPSAAENERASEVGAESVPAPAPAEAEADVNVAPSEWIHITPPHSTTVPNSDTDIHATDDLAPITTTAPSATAVPPVSAPSPTSELAGTGIPVGPKKLSRRERILHLARQNAQTPLPELPERPQPVAEAEAEKSQGESEQEGKERTIRERLWRLVGGNH